MAELKELRNRIDAIKSTQKITSAMKMIAAARLRKVQILVDKNKEYSDNLRHSALRVVTELEREEKDKKIRYIRPLLLRQKRNPQNYVVYVLSSDRGLCGAYNANIVKKATERLNQLQKAGKNTEVRCIGKKAYEVLKRHFNDKKLTFKLLTNDDKEFSYAAQAENLAKLLLRQFENNEFDVCEFVYSDFISALTRTFECEQLCPLVLNTEHLSPEKLENIGYAGDAGYEYLPDKTTVLTEILPILFNDNIFKVIVNAAASEHSARMSSMDNATRNAKKMISELTLKYNSLRQSAITTELIEIIAGADAV
ncbi:MAG: ATP synthase F1 subunit gamma [Alphaproteobacteria bacterium]|nr:ATP synthase F1 subunit gamma [Alphaproteobacteria bacterium]